MNRRSDAQLELEALQHILPIVPEDRVMHNNTCRTLLELSVVMLRGELLYRQGDDDSRCNLTTIQRI